MTEVAEAPVAAKRGEPIRWRRDPGVYETFAIGIAITASRAARIACASR